MKYDVSRTKTGRASKKFRLLSKAKKYAKKLADKNGTTYYVRRL